MLLTQLAKEVELANKALEIAKAAEVAGGYDYELTMERKWQEGFADAMSYALSLMNNAVMYVSADGNYGCDDLVILNDAQAAKVSEMLEVLSDSERCPYALAVAMGDTATVKSIEQDNLN